MKSIILVLALSLTCGTAAAAKNCAKKAESYLTNVGHTQPARLVDSMEDGLLVYEVRANQGGGDAAYEVIVDSRCMLISSRLLWSE
jgi:hypothetical protein